MGEAKQNGEKNVKGESNGPNEKNKRHKTQSWVYGALAVFAIVSYVAMPDPIQPPHGEEPSIRHVFYYGWLTSISTGLGAIPLVFASNLAPYWIGISNGE